MTKKLGFLLLLLLLLSASGASPVMDGWRESRMLVDASAYCAGPCTICQTSGITSTGKIARGRKGCATDPHVIPSGSRLDVPGYGTWIPADDVGGKIKRYAIDLRMDSHAEAVKHGRKAIVVRVWQRRKR